jgi:hypothetical protein
MSQAFVISAVMSSVLVTLAHGQTLEQPQRLAANGSAPLPVAGQATRADRLGGQELYRIAVYSQGGRSDRIHLASEDVAKALRIVITYEDNLRRPETRDWIRELVPRLEPAEVAHLRGTFAPLRYGDVVLIEYSPAKGTAVRVNSATAVPAAHHELMLEFLDHWLGQRPVSEEIKQALLEDVSGRSGS